MAVPYDQGARQKGAAPNFKQKVGFFVKFRIFIDIMPIINGFNSFLGDIGHFWSPNFGRKLVMDNQLQIYINQACLRPWMTKKAELC
jgi:hypothetical protein